MRVDTKKAAKILASVSIREGGQEALETVVESLLINWFAQEYANGKREEAVKDCGDCRCKKELPVNNGLCVERND